MINLIVRKAALSAIVVSALAAQAFAADNQAASSSTPTVIETIEHAATVVWGTLTHATVVWGSHH